MSVEHLRFSTEMLHRLGEELNPNPDQGILELVRNAYDADAATCTVELINPERADGSIRIVDDGNGMGEADIRDGWLVIGRSTKATSQKSRKRKRLQIGNKGIGRLAALRLGRRAVLTTRPVDEPQKEFRITFDWNAYSKAALIDDVSLQLETRRRSKDSQPGTTIEIEDLVKPLVEGDTKRLARAMVLLADPFDTVGGTDAGSGFRPVLKTSEYDDLAALVTKRYFDESEYHLRAELDDRGRAKATVTDYHGKVVFRAQHKDLHTDPDRRVYQAPPAVFDLWAYLLGKTDFSLRSVRLSEIRSWLGEFGGVHLYHRGMRVHPYSDFDWLDMNLSRSRSPELRPSTNTSIGRLAVVDPEGKLTPKTDRVGFIDDEPFQELRRFAIDALEWMAHSRLKDREKRREAKKAQEMKQAKLAKESLDEAVESVPGAERETVKKAVAKYARAKEREENTLKEDLQLYRTLGTVGATSAAFAHQANSPLAHIASSAGSLEDLFGESPAELDFETLKGMAGTIRSSAESLLAFSKVTLSLLQHEKRRRGTICVHDVIKDVEKILKPFLTLRSVSIKREFQASQSAVLGSKAAIESIITNLVINSLQAFSQSGTGKRMILFRTRNTKKIIELTVMDTGTGIEDISVDDIWLPGRTTTQQGTGLGLTIVKDDVTDRTQLARCP